MNWFSLPRVPNIRKMEDIPSIESWLNDLRREVSRALTEIQISGPTKALVGWRGAQTVATGFTIDPNAPIITLNATFAANSSGSEAIKDGSDGQWLILVNKATNNLTLMNNANLITAYGTHTTLHQHECLHAVWNGFDWVEVSKFISPSDIGAIRGVGVSTITVSSTPPVDPQLGDIWIDTIP